MFSAEHVWLDGAADDAGNALPPSVHSIAQAWEIWHMSSAHGQRVPFPASPTARVHKKIATVD